jgi:hypothetical protein
MITTRFHFVRVSGNRKTGPIPVTSTSAETCPPECGLFRECYGKFGHLLAHWRKYTAANAPGPAAGLTIDELCAHVRTIPGGSLWRHNVVGDLPGIGADIDAAALSKMVRANRGRRGFTYTHKPATPENLAAIRAATRAGFTINLSADNAAQADQLAAHGLPVTVVIPAAAPKVSRTPRGRKVIQCPAENSDRITCANCGLCALANRNYLIGFKPKGTKRRAVDAIAKGNQDND